MSLGSGGNGKVLRCFKFVIPPRDQRVIDVYPDGSMLKAAGCFAVAIAESPEAAIELLTRIAEEEGDDARWLRVATVTCLDIDKPKRLGWVLF